MHFIVKRLRKIGTGMGLGCAPCLPLCFYMCFSQVVIAQTLSDVPAVRNASNVQKASTVTLSAALAGFYNGESMLPVAIGVPLLEEADRISQSISALNPNRANRINGLQQVLEISTDSTEIETKLAKLDRQIAKLRSYMPPGSFDKLNEKQRKIRDIVALISPEDLLGQAAEAEILEKLLASLEGVDGEKLSQEQRQELLEQLKNYSIAKQAHAADMSAGKSVVEHQFLMDDAVKGIVSILALPTLSGQSSEAFYGQVAQSLSQISAQYPVGLSEVAQSTFLGNPQSTPDFLSFLTPEVLPERPSTVILASNENVGMSAFDMKGVSDAGSLLVPSVGGSLSQSASSGALGVSGGQISTAPDADVRVALNGSGSQKSLEKPIVMNPLHRVDKGMDRVPASADVFADSASGDGMPHESVGDVAPPSMVSRPLAGTSASSVSNNPSVVSNPSSTESHNTGIDDRLQAFFAELDQSQRVAESGATQSHDLSNSGSSSVVGVASADAAVQLSQMAAPWLGWFAVSEMMSQEKGSTQIPYAADGLTQQTEASPSVAGSLETGNTKAMLRNAKVAQVPVLAQISPSVDNLESVPELGNNKNLKFTKIKFCEQKLSECIADRSTLSQEDFNRKRREYGSLSTCHQDLEDLKAATRLLMLDQSFQDRYPHLVDQRFVDSHKEFLSRKQKNQNDSNQDTENKMFAKYYALDEVLADPANSARFRYLNCFHPRAGEIFELPAPDGRACLKLNNEFSQNQNITDAIFSEQWGPLMSFMSESIVQNNELSPYSSQGVATYAGISWSHQGGKRANHPLPALVDNLLNCPRDPNSMSKFLVEKIEAQEICSSDGLFQISNELLGLAGSNPVPQITEDNDLKDLAKKHCPKMKIDEQSLSALRSSLFLSRLEIVRGGVAIAHSMSRISGFAFTALEEKIIPKGKRDKSLHKPSSDHQGNTGSETHESRSSLAPIAQEPNLEAIAKSEADIKPKRSASNFLDRVCLNSRALSANILENSKNMVSLAGNLKQSESLADRNQDQEKKCFSTVEFVVLTENPLRNFLSQRCDAPPPSGSRHASEIQNLIQSSVRLYSIKNDFVSIARKQADETSLGHPEMSASDFSHWFLAPYKSEFEKMADGSQVLSAENARKLCKKMKTDYLKVLDFVRSEDVAVLDYWLEYNQSLKDKEVLREPAAATHSSERD